MRSFVAAPIAALLAAVALVAMPAHGQAPAWEAGSDGLRPVPALSAHVTDLTDTLSADERARLESKLAAFEDKTGAQMAVLIVPTTQPEPVEAYALRVADAWKIGRKGRDDGVLLLVAKNDRRLRMEIGYGLEGLIPDAIAKRIVAEDVAPKFREGRYAAGIDSAADRVIGIVEKGELPPPEKRASQKRGGAAGLDWGTILILALVVLPAVGGVLKSIFGKLGGATVGGALAGGIVWWVIGSIALAVGAAVVAWIAILIVGGLGGMMTGGQRGGPVWIPTGGGWGGGGGGLGGGWSGGGGGFGGGGASGDW
jgi:uncharacterized protein